MRFKDGIPNNMEEWKKEQEEMMEYDPENIFDIPDDYQMHQEDCVNQLLKEILQGLEEEVGRKLWPLDAIKAAYWNGNQSKFQFNSEYFYLGVRFLLMSQSIVLSEFHDGVEIDGFIVRLDDLEQFELLMETRPGYEDELYCPSCGISMRKKANGNHICSCGIECLNGEWEGVGQE